MSPPNNSYLRSRKREWEIMHFLREQGFDAARAAGSHSPWDVWGFNPETKMVCLIQIKTKKGCKNKVIKDEKTYENVTVKTWTQSWE